MMIWPMIAVLAASCEIYFELNEWVIIVYPRLGETSRDVVGRTCRYGYDVFEPGTLLSTWEGAQEFSLFVSQAEENQMFLNVSNNKRYFYKGSGDDFMSSPHCNTFTLVKNGTINVEPESYLDCEGSGVLGMAICQVPKDVFARSQIPAEIKFELRDWVLIAFPRLGETDREVVGKTCQMHGYDVFDPSFHSSPGGLIELGLFFAQAQENEIFLNVSNNKSYFYKGDYEDDFMSTTDCRTTTLFIDGMIELQETIHPDCKGVVGMALCQVPKEIKFELTELLLIAYPTVGQVHREIAERTCHMNGYGVFDPFTVFYGPPGAVTESWSDFAAMAQENQLFVKVSNNKDYFFKEPGQNLTSTPQCNVIKLFTNGLLDSSIETHWDCEGAGAVGMVMCQVPKAENPIIFDLMNWQFLAYPKLGNNSREEAVERCTLVGGNVLDLDPRIESTEFELFQSQAEQNEEFKQLSNDKSYFMGYPGTVISEVTTCFLATFVHDGVWNMTSQLHLNCESEQALTICSRPKAIVFDLAEWEFLAFPQLGLLSRDEALDRCTFADAQIFAFDPTDHMYWDIKRPLDALMRKNEQFMRLSNNMPYLQKCHKTSLTDADSYYLTTFVHNGVWNQTWEHQPACETAFALTLCQRPKRTVIVFDLINWQVLAYPRLGYHNRREAQLRCGRDRIFENDPMGKYHEDIDLFNSLARQNQEFLQLSNSNPYFIKRTDKDFMGTDDCALVSYVDEGMWNETQLLRPNCTSSELGLILCERFKASSPNMTHCVQYTHNCTNAHMSDYYFWDWPVSCAENMCDLGHVKEVVNTIYEHKIATIDLTDYSVSYEKIYVDLYPSTNDFDRQSAQQFCKYRGAVVATDIITNPSAYVKDAINSVIQSDELLKHDVSPYWVQPDGVSFAEYPSCKRVYLTWTTGANYEWSSPCNFTAKVMCERRV